MKKLNVVVVGLRFGAAFVPLYLNHPDVAGVGVCDTDAAAIQNIVNRYGHVIKTYSSFDDVLADENVDCVHILTPPMFHVEMSEKALLAGKHTACAVTMGTTIDGLQRVVDAVKKSGRNYAMMETAIFTRNFLYAKDMLDTGKMGEVQFLKSEYYQDVEGLQDHWIGYPPMHYASHAIAPLMYLAKSRVKSVFCMGSGTIPEDMVKRYGNPFAVEIAVIEFENGLKGSVARSFNNVAKEYIEQFDVYGSKATFEWQQINVEENPVVYTISDSTFGTKGYYTWREVGTYKVQPGDFPDGLPESLIPYLREAVYHEVLNPEKTYVEGGGHHGSHPFLVHDFIRSVIENRKPVCNEIAAANICAAGILAHESALQNGVLLSVPEIK